MQQFPDESGRSEEVQRKLVEAFDFAEALLNFWLRHDKNGHYARSNLPRQCLILAIGLDVQGCRLFRSVIDDCRRCEAYTASILARSLYETVLGTAFVLAKRVHIVVEPVMSGGKPKVTPEGAVMYCAKLPYKAAGKTPKNWLSRDLRGKLYLAHSYFENEETAIERLGRIPGQKRNMKKAKKSIDPTLAIDYEKAIGPEWTYILRNHRSYSGLSVANLAKVLHRQLHLWYETVYYFQSRDAHGSDALRHVDNTEDTVTAVYLSSDWEVYQALRTAIGMFFANMHILHENIGFGSGVDSGFHSLKRKFKQLSFEKVATAV